VPPLTSASDLSSDDESEGEQLKRAVTFADKRERMAVARAERDLLRLSSRRERAARRTSSSSSTPHARHRSCT
jgi:hypothetical protein